MGKHFFFWRGEGVEIFNSGFSRIWQVVLLMVKYGFFEGIQNNQRCMVIPRPHSPENKSQPDLFYRNSFHQFQRLKISLNDFLEVIFLPGSGFVEGARNFGGLGGFKIEC